MAPCGSQKLGKAEVRGVFTGITLVYQGGMNIILPKFANLSVWEKESVVEDGNFFCGATCISDGLLKFSMSVRER